MRISSVILLLLIFAVALKSDAWPQDALRLTGESESVRQQAIQRLKSRPHLTKELKKALHGDKQSLALDVIAVLGLQELLPDLLEASEEDESGFIHLTINSLLTRANRQQITKAYHQQLVCSKRCKTSGPVQVALLETMGRLKEPLSTSLLLRLFRETDWPEVKIAVLGYIRSDLAEKKTARHLSLIRLALKSQPVQVRERALLLLSDLPPADSKRMIHQIKSCNDGVFGPSARQHCLKLKEMASQ